MYSTKFCILLKFARESLLFKLLLLFREEQPRYGARVISMREFHLISKRLRKWKRREDIIHKLTKYIVDIALSFNAEIVMEGLKRIKEKILANG